MTESEKYLSERQLRDLLINSHSTPLDERIHVSHVMDSYADLFTAEFITWTHKEDLMFDGTYWVKLTEASSESPYWTTQEAITMFKEEKVRNFQKK